MIRVESLDLWLDRDKLRSLGEYESPAAVYDSTEKIHVEMTVQQFEDLLWDAYFVERNS